MGMVRKSNSPHNDIKSSHHENFAMTDVIPARDLGVYGVNWENTYATDANSLPADAQNSHSKWTGTVGPNSAGKDIFCSV